jgi:arsenate reductase
MASTTVLYGIPNCDTVKRARAWLDAHGVAYHFHDYKKAGVPEQRLADWAQALGWDSLLNRKGATWRRLDDAQRAGAADAAGARRLMLDQPSVIRRPVVEWADGGVTVGFDADAWAGRNPA